MSPDKGQGTIPLEDMRNKSSSNGQGVIRKDRKGTRSTDVVEQESAKSKEKAKDTDQPTIRQVKDSDQPPHAEEIEDEKTIALDDHDDGDDEADVGDGEDEAEDRMNEQNLLPKITPSNQSLCDFHPGDVTDIHPDLVPSRKYNLNMPMLPDMDASDDEFDMCRMPVSVYSSSSMDDFPTMEKEPFSDNRQMLEGLDARESQGSRFQIQKLHDTIRVLKEEKEYAEREAIKAQEQLEEWRQFLSSDINEIATDAQTLDQANAKLKEENRRLKEELNDAQSHIFSLQPYHKDLTAEEVGRQYDELVEQVQDWVQKFMEPYLDDYEIGLETLMTNARKQSSELSRFKRTMQKYPDLIHGCMFPETDEDIVVAIIMRFLNDNIFQKVLYGSIQSYTEMIGFMENQMQTSVQPKRDIFAVRTWTAEGYTALISAPQFKAVRTRRSKDFSLELATILQIFCKKEKLQWFVQNMEEHCVAPAMALYEKIQVSTHHFYLDNTPYIGWGPGSRLTLSAEFLDHVEKVECKNILQNRKAFIVTKIDPRPTKEELCKQLTNVCTVVPALYIRQIGQRDAIKRPAVVRKQQMLVAWGSEEKRDKFLEDNEDSLISSVYFSRKHKGGGSNWSPW